ncbi:MULTISPECIES: hypothetical protein [Listeria]|uniref:hypothetical protein n=1 Tax=Listeria TaxID=1637 RepID=UPI0013565F33|nr:MULTISPECIES: hypothetical protein [Listeria]
MQNRVNVVTGTTGANAQGVRKVLGGDMQYISFSKRMKELGFHVVADKIPYRLFMCDITRNVSLVVEGFHDRKKLEYRYTFYRMYHGRTRFRASSYRVYADDVTAFQLIQCVKRHMKYYERGV